MMKKLIFAFFTFFVLPLTACAEEPKTIYKEGTHYEVLPLAATAKPNLTEYFSFFCPHCYKFESVVAAVKPKLNKDIKFEKSHVNFLPQRRPDLGNLLTKALATAQLLGVEGKITAQLFETIHIKKQYALTEKAISSIFVANGVSEKKFNSAFNSFMVNGTTGQMNTAQETVRITSVPTFVVNGKYKVITKSVKGEEEFAKLVNHLSTLK